MHHLEWEDDDLVAFVVPLQTGVAVGLETRERRERDLLFPRILPRTYPTRSERVASSCVGGAPGGPMGIEGCDEEARGAGVPKRLQWVGGLLLQWGGVQTMERKETSPPIWMRPTSISTIVPLPLA